MKSHMNKALCVFVHVQRNAITMLGPLKSNNVCVEVRTETVFACFLINIKIFAVHKLIKEMCRFK